MRYSDFKQANPFLWYCVLTFALGDLIFVSTLLRLHSTSPLIVEGLYVTTPQSGWAHINDQ